MADKQPTFRERIELLEDAAKRLDEVAAVIAAEVERMGAAEKRFTARDAKRKPKADR